MKHIVRQAGTREWVAVDAPTEIKAQENYVDEHVKPAQGAITFTETAMFFGTAMPPQEILDAGERSGDLVLSYFRVECIANDLPAGVDGRASKQWRGIRSYATRIVTAEEMRAELAAKRTAP